MDATFMTPTQLRELANKKEEESKLAKVGYLKFDLYSFDDDENEIDFNNPTNDEFWLATPGRVKEIKKIFSNGFKLALKKGTKFGMEKKNGMMMLIMA